MAQFKTGDDIDVECQGRKLRGSVVLASPNGDSLAVAFDGMLTGHLGMAPLLRGPDGVYRSIMDEAIFTLTPVD